MPRIAAKAQPAAQPVTKARVRAGFRQVWDDDAKAWTEYRVAAPSILDALLGDGRIAGDEFQAGLRFQTAFERAHLGPRYGHISLDAVRVEGGPIWREPIGGSESAKAEVAAALRYVNGLGADALHWILGMGEGVAQYTLRCRSTGRLVHERTIAFVLITALGALAAFYQGRGARSAHAAANAAA